VVPAAVRANPVADPVVAPVVAPVHPAAAVPATIPQFGREARGAMAEEGPMVAARGAQVDLLAVSDRQPRR
jgi:hypothetical protein